MATYEEAGVNIEMGDECSRIAYKSAKATFSSRDGMIGRPVILEGGFSGAMDFGDFYLVQNDDGIGTKMAVATQMGKYDTMGYDLLAMVADDAICVGAETVSISNTIDVEKVNKEVIGQMMEGLEKACKEHKIVIPGGEIAELGTMINGYVWNATAIGIVEKEKFITCKNVEPGMPIIGLHSDMFRSNGMTLVRHVLSQNFGPEWHKVEFEDGKTWGEVVLTPTRIYHSAVLEMIGRYKQPRLIDVRGIAHITGGGLPGNVIRIVKGNGLGARLDSIPEPKKPMKVLQEIGKISDEEAYKTWNMGVGMTIVSPDTEKIIEIAGKYGIKAQKIGEVTSQPGIIVGDMKF